MVCQRRQHNGFARADFHQNARRHARIGRAERPALGVIQAARQGCRNLISIRIQVVQRKRAADRHLFAHPLAGNRHFRRGRQIVDAAGHAAAERQIQFIPAGLHRLNVHQPLRLTLLQVRPAVYTRQQRAFRQRHRDGVCPVEEVGFLHRLAIGQVTRAGRFAVLADNLVRHCRVHAAHEHRQRAVHGFRGGGRRRRRRGRRSGCRRRIRR